MLDVEAIDSESLTAHRTMVTAPEIVMAVANAARRGADVCEVLDGVRAITARAEVTRVGVLRIRGHVDRRTGPTFEHRRHAGAMQSNSA